MAATKFCCLRVSNLFRRRRKNISDSSNTRRSRISGSDANAPQSSSPKETRLFSYHELRSATANFHPTNKVGRGGFGLVYKGTLRDGTRVAVKSLSAESKQGINEFLTEINMVSNVRHPNLVQLLGCCIQGRKRMLVYEYLENNSLAFALLGPKSKQISMDWSRRAAICEGAARGLAFLHEEAEPNIVHRDIKASNLLLDRYLVPKIGDFGLAKLFPDSVSHISTRVAGTMGYLAPEYALLGQLTKKADIYSFGVLILEIVSGRGCSACVWGEDMKVLLEWTWGLRDEERLLDIVDPKLVDYPEEQVLRYIKVALLCTQATSQQRPAMKQVLEMLSKDIHLDVNNLAQPGVVKEADQTSSDSAGSSYGRTRTTRGNNKSTDGRASITSLRKTNTTSFSTLVLQPR